MKPLTSKLNPKKPGFANCNKPFLLAIHHEHHLQVPFPKGGVTEVADDGFNVCFGLQEQSGGELLENSFK